MATPPSLDIASLLSPIAEDHPSGRNLAYDPEFDALREARRAEDDTLQGDWQRKAKTAQWDRVLALGTELLKRKTKDLQVAAWITEALAKLHGFAGLRDGLRLLDQLQQTFWDSCFPEIDDGDLEPRQGPYLFLNANNIVPFTIRSLPLTQGLDGQRYSFLQREESRRTDNVGLKNPELMATLIAEGKLTTEQFDGAVAQTPRAFYETLFADIEECLAAYKELDQRNDTLFGRDAPSLNEIRKALDDCRACLEPILARKRELEPDPEPETDDASQLEPASEEAESPADGEEHAATSPPRRPATAARRSPRGSGGPIASVDDAQQRILEAAAYLRQNDPASPVPFAVVRALRMGALYGMAQPLDPSQCESPSRETRQGLKRLAAEGDWGTLLEQAEQSLGGPEGGAWLDAQRYAIAAMTAVSDPDRTGVAAACRSLLRALLHDHPDLPRGELNDGTPTANAETRAWIESEILPPGSSAYIPPAESYNPAPPPAADTPEAPPDAWEEAQQRVRAGRVPEALQLLRRALNTATTGRERFLRKLQLAELCLMVNQHRVALPLSEDLARMADEFHIEEWEDEQWSARVWAALYRCLRQAGAGNGSPERLQQVFTRLCRLDINQALAYGNDPPG